MELNWNFYNSFRVHEYVDCLQGLCCERYWPNSTTRVILQERHFFVHFAFVEPAIAIDKGKCLD